MIPRDDDQDMTQALVRDVGQRSVAQLGEGATRMIGETSALSRWLLTMLVLLNGAALWLCLGDPVSARFGAAPLFFFAGALVAILAAVAGLVMALRAAGTMRAAIALWTEVASSGALTDEALAAARRVRRTGLVWMGVIALFSLGSLGLFLAGAWTAWRAPAAQPPAPPAAVVSDAPPPDAAAPPANEAGAAGIAPRVVEAAPTPVPAPVPSPTPSPRAAVPPPGPPARAAMPSPRPSPRAAMPQPRPSPSPLPGARRPTPAPASIVVPTPRPTPSPSPSPSATAPPPRLPVAPLPPSDSTSLPSG